MSRLSQFWRIGWPVSSGMALTTVLSLVDLGFVSTLGKNAIAGVGVVGSMIWLLSILPDLFAAGVLAAVARAIGAGKPGEAGAALRSGLIGAWLMSLLIAIPSILFAPQLVSFFNLEPEVAAIAVSFFRIILSGFPLTATILVVYSALFGAGQTKAPLVIMGIANLLNIALNPCLIMGLGPFPRMGTDGSATATLISTAVAAILAFLHVHSRRSPSIPFGANRGREGGPWMLRLMRVGSKAAAQSLMRPLTAVILNRIVASFGTAAIASFSVGVRCLNFAFIFTTGLNVAASSLVGQALGRKDPDDAQQSADLALRFNFFLQLILSTIYFFAAGAIISLFNQTGDAQVAYLGISYLQKISLGFVLGFMSGPLAGIFRGSGDTAPPMWAAFIANWPIKLGLAYVLSGLVSADWQWLASLLGSGFGLGVEGVWWGVAASLAVEGWVLTLFYRRGGWKHVTV